MTIQEILNQVRTAKPITRATLYTHLNRMKIRPVSRVRQIPQHYPEDTPERLLKNLGLTTRKGARR